MDKRRVVILLGLLILLSVGGGLYFFSAKNNKSNVVQQAVVEKNILSPSKSLKEYTDNSGFAFQYPDNLILKNLEVDSKSVYSQLELSSKDNDGKIEVIVEDTKDKTFQDWVTTNKITTTSASIINNTKLGTLPASIINNKSDSTIVAIDQGVEFIIKTNFGEDKKYWQSVQQTVLSTFAFSQPQSSTSSQDSQGSDVFFEGEETVE